MATTMPTPRWYDETCVYIVHGGPVESRTDGQVHHVSALAVAQLYGLRTGMQNVVIATDMQAAIRHRQAQRDLAATRYIADREIHLLGPVSDGNYSMPESVRPYLDANTTSTVDDDRATAIRYAFSQMQLHGASGLASAAEGLRRFGEAARNALPAPPRTVPGSSGPLSSEAVNGFSDAIRNASRPLTALAAARLDALRALSSSVGTGRLRHVNMAPDPMVQALAWPGAPRAAVGGPLSGRTTGPITAEEAQAWVKASTVPAQGSRAWIRVVKKGCVGERGLSGDFDCNDYAWGCDYCPVVVDRMERESALEKSVRGNRMHRFWRAKAKIKNEIDCNGPTMAGHALAFPGGDETVIVVGGRRTGRATLAKRYRKE